MIILLIVNHPNDTVDGRHPAPVEVGSLSHFLQLWGPSGWFERNACNTFFYDNTSQKMVDCLMRQPAVPHRFSGDMPTPENEHIP